MDADKIIEAVEKTGFPLEHRTAEAFVDAKWNVISNKYYIDENHQEVREIDLIAYKITKVEDILVYSTVIISCKKSSSNTWAFISRPSAPSDINKNRTPLHFWTNNAPLNHILSADGFDKIFNSILSRHAPSIWGSPDKEVYAFQELAPILTSRQNNGQEISKYNTNNDKAIFSSITSLMKAQAYELNRLPDRKKGQSIYIFNLLSVMDGDMAEVFFNKNGPSATETKLQKYVAHYIIKGAEQYSRITFIHNDILKKIIYEYDHSHVETVEYISNSLKDFYKNSVRSSSNLATLLPLFSKELNKYINIYGHIPKNSRYGENLIGLHYNDEKEILEIQINAIVEDSVMNEINTNRHILKATKSLLYSIYKYSGNYIFTDEITF